MGARQGYIPTLDGWRAVAICGVILSHSFASTCWTRHGALGVNLFFAISGFLITLRLLEEQARNGGISLKMFYMRRAFRILPAALFYLAVIAVLSAAGAIYSSPRDFLSCLLFMRNYWGGDAQHGWYTGHFWSLSVEEQFYLFWPALLVVAGVARARWIAPALALGFAVWRSLDMRHGWVVAVTHNQALQNHPFRSDYRMDSLLWGCALALILPRLRGRWTLPRGFGGVIGVAALACAIGLNVMRPQSYMAVQALLFPAVLFATVTQPAGRLSRFLEWPPLRWLGRLSYSLYLWQQPFVSQYHHGALQRFPLNVIFALACAAFSHYVIERPMVLAGRRLTKPLPTSPPPMRALAAAGSIG